MKYYNTDKNTLKLIKEAIVNSNVYTGFKIKFESPIGDVLYLKRPDSNYERYMAISNIKALGKYNLE